VNVERLTRRISGKSVSHVTVPDAGRLAVHFADGSILLVERRRQGLAATFEPGDSADGGSARGHRPTLRQREYLRFIARYILRFGVAPAESDIQRHFLLSAPAVNQMIQSLERLGFITRRRGVPRSICIVDQTDAT